jgi:hypothetical protein
MNPEQQKDEELWQVARCRARFKRHLFSYIVVCAFLWAIWLVTGNGAHYLENHFRFDEGFHYRYLPWPAWVMFWWGIALVFSFVKAYLVNMPGSVEREYQKLKEQQ